MIKRYRCFHLQAIQLVPLLLDAGVLFMYFIISKIFFLGFTTLGTKYDPHHRSGGEPTTLDRRLDSSTLGRHDGIGGGGGDAPAGWFILMIRIIIMIKIIIIIIIIRMT